MCTVNQTVSAGMLFGRVWSTIAADNAMTSCCIASLYYTCCVSNAVCVCVCVF